MTPDELRRIDALIDQHVFGHKVWWVRGEPLQPPEDGFPPSAHHSARVPTYTTSWAMAGQVVERIIEELEVHRFYRKDTDDWWYTVTLGPGWSEAASFPLAVCLAALKVVGVDVATMAQ